jgi:hypothetical protein
MGWFRGKGGREGGRGRGEEEKMRREGGREGRDVLKSNNR